MDIVFVSNYYNHHQQFLCEELNRRCDTFRFISTSVMREERRIMGYGIEEPQYVIHGYESDASAAAKNAITAADVLIVGAAQGEFAQPRLYRGKTVFYYSERLFKKPPKKWQIPLRAVKYYYRFMYRQNSYLLCSGAYTFADFAKTRTFSGRCFKWGYFPQTKLYDIDDLIRKKDKKKLLWCGRLLDWKHPEYAVELARRLREDGVDFSLDIIGDGVERDNLRGLIDRYGLDDCVELCGALTHERVREHMETAGVFLFTSDRQEGWGAVLNEAMNSGCAVVSGHAAGATPFLINDNENGLIFPSGDINYLYQAVKNLLNEPQRSAEIGKQAYKTITQLWNAETAAKRFISLSESIIENKVPSELYGDGPCSKAELLKDDWINGER